MAPSRGFTCSTLWNSCQIRISGQISCRLQARRQVSHSAPSFQDLVADPHYTRQIYVSRSTNPYLNLSIEHYLLQKSSPESTVLFLYTNEPCVVIGRNQNPWLEVNLRLLRQGQAKLQGSKKQSLPSEVLLVRRRSGGGAVFHDEGNVNYSVICPPSEFNRDKHAEMVVRALKKLGTRGIRVNERHDIVVDQVTAYDLDIDEDLPGTKSEMLDQSRHSSLKVSGSAYKLTRLRALHHGTCLLSSQNLESISKYLRSPARPYIKARGVESVRSRVANLGVENSAFERSVVNEFAELYDIEDDFRLGEPIDTAIERGEDWAKGTLSDECLSIADIKAGTEELMVCPSSFAGKDQV
jgi:lipoate-protein ligase A